MYIVNSKNRKYIKRFISAICNEKRFKQFLDNMSKKVRFIKKLFFERLACGNIKFSLQVEY